MDSGVITSRLSAPQRIIQVTAIQLLDNSYYDHMDQSDLQAMVSLLVHVILLAECVKYR